MIMVAVLVSGPRQLDVPPGPAAESKHPAVRKAAVIGLPRDR
jgi:hypothetical protein